MILASQDALLFPVVIIYITGLNLGVMTLTWSHKTILKTHRLIWSIAKQVKCVSASFNL